MSTTIEKRAVQLLHDHNIRKTNSRIEILTVLLKNEEQALSNQHFESSLTESDRVTLYRTLKTFEQKELIHHAMDGSGVNKYALCHSSCNEHQHVHDHAHFHCTNCGRTLCLDEIDTPQVELPLGYTVDKSYMVIQGQCNDCD